MTSTGRIVFKPAYGHMLDSLAIALRAARFDPHAHIELFFERPGIADRLAPRAAELREVGP